MTQLKSIFYLVLIATAALLSSCGGDDKKPAPAPSISGFTPTSGEIGASVTINGNNFSTTLAGNQVKFGAVAATVTAATATSLTTTVPSGATNGKISVTVNGQTAVSSTDFVVNIPPTIAAPTVAGAFQPGGELTVNFTTTGTFNAGNIFTAQLSDASGSFSNPTAIGTLNSLVAGTINATLPANANGTGYRIRVVASTPSTISPDNGTNLNIATPTITISSVVTSPSGQSFIPGRSVTIASSLTGTFASGNEFRLQLSDASGNFSQPIVVSTITNTTLNASLTGSFLPTTTLAGNGYRYRWVSTNPAITGAPSSAISVVIPSISAPTIMAGANLVAGGNIPLQFSPTNAPWFNDNQLIIQLSDASGSFASPATLITLSTNFATTLSPSAIFIPTNTPPGAGYRVRVVSTSPVITSEVSSAFAIGALPTLSVAAATPIFNKIYSGTVFPISYVMTVTKTGTFNANTTFSIEMSPADQPFGNANLTVATLSTINVNELNTNGSTNVNVSLRNLNNGNRRFRVRATGHQVQSSEISFAATQTDVTALTGTVESVNYTFGTDRCLFNTFGPGEPNNQTLFAYGASTSALYSEANMRLFVGFPTTADNINTGATQTCSVTIQLLNSNGQLLALFRNNSVSVNISGTPSGYTATIGSVTLTRITGTAGNTTLNVQSLSTNFKLQ